MRAVLVGAVDSTAVALDELVRAPEWSVRMVVTLPLDLQKRHSDFCDLSPLAEQAGAKFHATRNCNDLQTIEAIRDCDPDYIFVIGWSQICKADFLAVRPGKCIGYHPAALPRLRGRAAIPWTILLDEPITAGSLFWLADGADTGELLAQEYFHVARDETARSLYDKHLAALRAMFRRVLPELAVGVESRLAQDERYATLAGKRTPEDGLIDWHGDARAIARLVRAVGRPYPGAFTDIAGQRLKIWSARPALANGMYHAVPGQIVSLAPGKMTVMTGDGLLEISEWESEPSNPPRVQQVLGRARG